LNAAGRILPGDTAEVFRGSSKEKKTFGQPVQWRHCQEGQRYGARGAKQLAYWARKDAEKPSDAEAQRVKCRARQRVNSRSDCDDPSSSIAVEKEITHRSRQPASSRAGGKVLRGWAPRSVSGSTAGGIAWIEDGIRDYRATGSMLRLPYFSQ
jgi:hypothetical protein